MATVSEIMGSAIYNISSCWHGFSAIKNLVVFGASYCAVRKGSYKEGFLHPIPGQPLGIKFPGDTFAEPGMPNWVGHLVTKHALHGEIMAYCYAVGGATVDGVNRQIRDTFPLEIGKNLKSEWAPQDWDPTNTLFVTWVGINDCAFGGDIDTKMLTLETAHQHLYAAGARNFLFIDLPPIDRSPGIKRREKFNSTSTAVDGTAILVFKLTTGSNLLSPAPKALDRSHIFKKWNQELSKYVRLFVDAHPKEITAMIYSSYDTFTRVLDDPESHGFALEDVGKKGGAIWRDDLHPTSAMHDIVAKDIALLLNNQPASVGE